MWLRWCLNDITGVIPERNGELACMLVDSKVCARDEGVVMFYFETGFW
jgi:hypothetical protein